MNYPLDFTVSSSVEVRGLWLGGQEEDVRAHSSSAARPTDPAQRGGWPAGSGTQLPWERNTLSFSNSARKASPMKQTRCTLDVKCI